jgi:hypothetical protein
MRRVNGWLLILVLLDTSTMTREDIYVLSDSRRFQKGNESRIQRIQSLGVPGRMRKEI